MRRGQGWRFCCKTSVLQIQNFLHISLTFRRKEMEQTKISPLPRGSKKRSALGCFVDLLIQSQDKIYFSKICVRILSRCKIRIFSYFYKKKDFFWSQTFCENKIFLALTLLQTPPGPLGLILKMELLDKLPLNQGRGHFYLSQC